jgi:hypothetical protein
MSMKTARRYEKPDPLRIVVGGYIGLLPAGGVTWDYLQYPLGFAALGHDVFYVEDTRVWPVYQPVEQAGFSCATNVDHLARVMDTFGMSERWAYRDEVSGKCFGMSQTALDEVCRTADIFVNVSCSTFLRDEYRSIPVRALIDTDPMFTQIQLATQEIFTAGESGMRTLVEGHTHHFTYGENIGGKDCRIPTAGVNWRATRQPVCLDQWPVTPARAAAHAAFTTVMNWSAGRALEYDGEHWGQKDVEFLRLLELPRRTSAPLAVVVGQTTGEPFPAETAARHGWNVLDPAISAPDWITYRDFIQASLGEVSVAKETYVKAVTGWFSGRSACYLASGRPVVTQDTGWTRYLPSGTGLIGFDTADQALAGIEAILSDPSRHAASAREIAEVYFGATRVLEDLLSQMT